MEYMIRIPLFLEFVCVCVHILCSLPFLCVCVSRAKEGGGAGDRGGDRLDASPQKITTKTPPSFEEKGVGVPLAGELFGLEEALLLGRGEKHAEQRKELALQK